MPNFPRTDLAVEAEAIHRSAAAVTELPGVRAEETERRGFAVTEVHVLDVAGENALCKPIGDYYTLALDPLLRREDDAFENAAQTLAELLRGVLPLMPDASVLDVAGENALCKPIGDYYTLALDPLLRREDDAFENAAQTLAELLRGVLPLMPDASVLVVGLGNRAITPDAVGPDAIDSVMVTRHLREQLPEHFGQFRSVAALAAGVPGTTGVESADMIRALAGHLRPDAIIAVDALACAELGRLGRTVQLTDTGITPGSGVGNDRAGLSRDTLGIPVAAIGLPTVIDAGGFSDDPRAEQMFVTPRDIDTVVRDAAKLIGYGINLALHDGLTIGDVDMFLS